MYIAMELVSGETLRASLEGHRLDLERTLEFMAQVADALDAAHAAGVTHRDLKPENLMIAEGGYAKVLDFGIAKLMGRGDAGTKTRTGQLLGTPMYMSPEQCRGVKQIDSRSDIYSLGCIMYEVFCGNAPFLDEGFGDLIIAHVSRPPPEPMQAPWKTTSARGPSSWIRRAMLRVVRIVCAAARSGLTPNSLRSPPVEKQAPSARRVTRSLSTSGSPCGA